MLWVWQPIRWKKSLSYCTVLHGPTTGPSASLWAYGQYAYCPLVGTSGSTWILVTLGPKCVLRYGC